jgi:hypothetical protein
VAVYSSLTSMLELPLARPADWLVDRGGVVRSEGLDSAQVA